MAIKLQRTSLLCMYKVLKPYTLAGFEPTTDRHFRRRKGLPVLRVEVPQVGLVDGLLSAVPDGPVEPGEEQLAHERRRLLGGSIRGLICLGFLKHCIINYIIINKSFIINYIINNKNFVVNYIHYK
jgi:hypothetical protein